MTTDTRQADGMGQAHRKEVNMQTVHNRRLPSMRRNLLGGFLHKAYAFNSSKTRQFIRRLIARMEGGEIMSVTLRDIMLTYHKVRIGSYTHGCFLPLQFDKNTTIGNYCSIASQVRAMNRNHPMNYKSMHGFFLILFWGCARKI